MAAGAFVNYHLFKDINDLSGNAAFDTLMKATAKYAIAVVFLALAVLCLLRLRERAIRPVLAVAAGLGATFLLGLAGAAAYRERRPFQSHQVHQILAHAGGQSFPSDHATAAFGVALNSSRLPVLALGFGTVPRRAAHRVRPHLLPRRHRRRFARRDHGRRCRRCRPTPQQRQPHHPPRSRAAHGALRPARQPRIHAITLVLRPCPRRLGGFGLVARPI